MFDYLDSFFKSNLAKNNIIAITIAVIVLLVIGAVIMWFYMSKIHMKCVINENEDLKKKVENMNNKIISLEQELKNVTENRDALLKMNDRLSFYNKMAKAKEFAENEEIDSAIEKFLN